MTSVEQQLHPIQLDFKDGDRVVVVSPDDQDRFVMTSQQAAQACKQALNFDNWKKEFYGLLSEVRQWTELSTDRIVGCFVAVREGGLVVIVVPTSEAFDFKLDATLTELDIRLATKYPLCRCEVLQVPGNKPESLVTFLDPTEAILIYGNQCGARSEVAS